MDLDRRLCDRARRSRDARFDGRFFIGVTTTRIYCRPICPFRAPKDEHVRYFPTAAAAEAEGYRPCLRYRPEASPGTPAWLGTAVLVSRALRLIGEGALDGQRVEMLADRLGVTARHLRRLFVRHLGAAPHQVALTRRLHFAKKLLDETWLPIREVAHASGFGSVRHFNSQIRSTYSQTPTELRRRSPKRPATDPNVYRLRLSYRPPYDWEAVLQFLEAQVIPGVERIDACGYQRTLSLDDRSGVVTVSPLPTGRALRLEVRFPDPRKLLVIVESARGAFDLGADPALIAEHLGVDPLLCPLVKKHPGIRNPEPWDDFEGRVRAMLGPGLAARVAATFGSRVASAGGVDLLFPTAAQIERAPLERAGLPPFEALRLRELSRQVEENGSGLFGLGEPDAFPEDDPRLRAMTASRSKAELRGRSERWRPWRAYAARLLLAGSRRLEDEKCGRQWPRSCFCARPTSPDLRETGAAYSRSAPTI
ncbi:MAG TPA: AlkA N-terminal domain-containing protein [Vicinamibacteria bacterium]|nr:AlkA N-terminal domain-containing protein [Vicinamibacteria bacterium]